MSNLSTPFTTPIAQRHNTEAVTPLPQTPRNTPHVTPVQIQVEQIEQVDNIINITPVQKQVKQVAPGAPKKPKSAISFLDNEPVVYNN